MLPDTPISPESVTMPVPHPHKHSRRDRGREKQQERDYAPPERKRSSTYQAASSVPIIRKPSPQPTASTEPSPPNRPPSSRPPSARPILYPPPQIVDRHSRTTERSSQIDRNSQIIDRYSVIVDRPPLVDRPAQIVSGPTQIVGGPSRIGDGPSMIVDGPTRIGEGPSWIGPGPSMIGEGPSRIGEGPSWMGEGPSRIGDGPSQIGSGPSQLVPPTIVDRPPPPIPAEHNYQSYPNGNENGGNRRSYPYQQAASGTPVTSQPPPNPISMPVPEPYRDPEEPPRRGNAEDAAAQAHARALEEARKLAEGDIDEEDEESVQREGSIMANYSIQITHVFFRLRSIKIRGSERSR